MLDKKSSALLNKINEICVNGAYKIVEVEELSSSLEKFFFGDEDAVRHSLEGLKDKGYVSIKYQDDEEICLCPLNKGRRYFEIMGDEKHDENKSRILSFFYCFLGGFSGSFAACLLFVIFYLLLR